MNPVPSNASCLHSYPQDTPVLLAPCSAFLGLKALLGGPRPALRRCGASAAMQGTAGPLRCPQAPGKAGQGLLCEAELDHLVAVKVEPLK